MHHPYSPRLGSVGRFLLQAATDAQVVAIKTTLDALEDDATIGRAVARAAERGVQVVVVAGRRRSALVASLEQVGAELATRIISHPRWTASLVIRREGEGLVRYSYLGTGGNGSEGLGLLSADSGLGGEVADLFNYLTGYSHLVRFRRLLVAPATLRPSLVGLIEREAAHGTEGYIALKLNRLTDPEVVGALDEAVREGTAVDVVVRGACRLRPHSPGDRVRLRSLIAHPEEESRIYIFGTGERRRVWIGSADAAPRDLDQRVEVLAEVDDPLLGDRLASILDVYLDEPGAWNLVSDGTWRRTAPHVPSSTRGRLRRLAESAAGDRRLTLPLPT